MSQIIAGSLAAVTSFLLSAKIGIAGSVIGAAASYVISTLAANIYGTILKASSEKLQEVNPLSGNGTPQEDDGGADDGTDAGRDESSGKDVTGVETDQDDDKTLIGRFDRASVLAAGNDARRARGLGIADVPLPPAAGRTARGTASSSTSGESTYNVSELRRGRRIGPKRMAVIVSVVSGLLGVAITAGVVMLVTGGHGTDTVVRDIVSPSSTSKTPTDETGTQNAPTAPDGTTEQRNPNEDYGTDDETKQNSGTGTTGGTAENGSSSSGGSSSDSSGTGSTSGSTGSGTTGSGSTGETNGSTGSGTTGSESSNGTSGSTGSGTTGSGTTGSESGTTSGSTGSGTTGSGGTSN
ncbi:hypothetical protein [Bifidobacterium aesculapii]|uniref:hypothetical protein n=1 Tax=Bifidobacterium aesculapii TaxID=1329411 RepID=UPI0009EB58D4|nr:hypothetical protein [Bifidobacterium aesculapii]